MEDDGGNVSPVDSLDGDNQSKPNGVIKVANESLLTQLTAGSPMPATQAPTYRATSDYSHQMHTDLSDYQYVNSDYEDDNAISPIRELSAGTQARNQFMSSKSTALPIKDLSAQHTYNDNYNSPTKELSAPRQSNSPQISAANNAGKDVLSVDKFVPPLALTDSLIADDPQTDGSKAVNDSLDSSMGEEDLHRLENLMNNKQPLPNPFNGQQAHTPNTMNELSLSLALVKSATPRPIYSQAEFQSGMTSSLADEDLATPRVSQHQQDIPDQINHQQLQHENGAPHLASPEYSFVPRQQFSDRVEETPSETQEEQYYQQLQQAYQKQVQKANSHRGKQQTTGPRKSNTKHPNTKQQKQEKTYSQQPQYVQRPLQDHQPQQSYNHNIPHNRQPTFQNTNTAISSRSGKLSTRDDGNSSPKLVGRVAPKPSPPDKDFIERNINRARGVNSAKGGYANRMVKSKQQQEEMRNWAPGMVVPRKKAASADNALRVPRSDVDSHDTILLTSLHQPPLHNVWERNTTQISQANMDKLHSKSSAHNVKDSVIESKVKFNVDLEPNGYISHHDNQMRLIGPIPQSHMKSGKQVAFVQNEGSTGSVPIYHSPTGPVYPSSLQHQVQPSEGGGHAVYDHQMKQAIAQSYNDLYQSNVQGTLSDYESNSSYHTESRWNPRPKPSNFVPDEKELSLDDIIALEQGKLTQQSAQVGREANRATMESSHSGSDLNPYQTVPPIHQQLSQESTDSNEGNSQSYSQIHKNIKEKEGRGDNYKKYTLKDYKKLNKEVKLGGLGPSTDPAVLREKHDVRQKQLDLARQARESEAKKAKARAKEVKKDEKPGQPSGRQLAVEYAKTVPKPKVVPKTSTITTQPVSTLHSARSLNKLNELDLGQLTYRTNHTTVPDHLANHRDLSIHLANDNELTHQLTNDGVNEGGAIPHSYSSPSLSQTTSSNQLNYLDTIQLLHQRHLQEKRLIAGIRQKI